MHAMHTDSCGFESVLDSLVGTILLQWYINPATVVGLVDVAAVPQVKTVLMCLYVPKSARPTA